MKQMLLAGKDEQLAEAHKVTRSLEAEVAELKRRLERMGNTMATQREELKMRSEQQRLVSEKLRLAEDSLSARKHVLSEREEMAKVQMAQVAGSAERLQESLKGVEALQAQLSKAHERSTHRSDSNPQDGAANRTGSQPDGQPIGWAHTHPRVHPPSRTHVRAPAHAHPRSARRV